MSAEPPSFEQQKWAHEVAQRAAERAHDSVRQLQEKLNEAAITSAELALRTAVLINGGAAVSVLAFIGGLVSQGRVGVPAFNAVASSLLWFAAGVAVAAGGMACAYFTNYCYANAQDELARQWDHPWVVETKKSQWRRRAGGSFHIGAVVLGLGSLVFFIIGMIDVRYSITKLL